MVVVDGESTGKSSLLENITKCAVFPRDRDICTRMPIRLQLTNVVNASNGSVEVQFGQERPQILHDSSEILGAVEVCGLLASKRGGGWMNSMSTCDR